jgi:tetrapyrrole methylase family protein/MazG family protein
MQDESPVAITVLGLGPGDPGLVTTAALRALDSARTVWLRTARHPAATSVAQRRPVGFCDDLYEGASFEAVYEAIARRVVASAADGTVAYAVPGDPAFGETSVVRLRQLADEAGLKVAVLPGVSFVGPTLALLGWDALDGLQVLDGMALAAGHYPTLCVDRRALAAQVYSQTVASHLKLVLLAAYPPDHPVTVVKAAGTSGAKATTVPLAELDRHGGFDDLTTVAVPPLPRPGCLASLADVVARLRAPDGCPWDREQTHQSLRPFLLEETYEALEALDQEDLPALSDELGDLLLQIALHAELAWEAGAFGLPDVVAAITEKVIRRHPHVFGGAALATPAEVRVRWEELKGRERAAEGAPADPLAGLPSTLPALARAQSMQRKLHDAGALGQPRKGHAAASRWREALGPQPDDPAGRQEAVGQALWALVTAAGSWGVDAESALRQETDRVARRAGSAAAPPTNGG